MSQDQNLKKSKQEKQQLKQAIRKARFSKPSTQELREIISGKQREFIHRQAEFRRLVAELAELEEVLMALKYWIDKLEKQHPNTERYSILFDFGSETLPIECWKKRFNSKRVALSNALRSTQHLHDSLTKEYGLTEKQIEEVLDGKYISKLPQ